MRRFLLVAACFICSCFQRWRLLLQSKLYPFKSVILLNHIWKQQSRLTVTALRPILANSVEVMKRATFLQEAVDLIGSWSQFPGACSDQVVKQDVIVVNFQLQNVTFLGMEPAELLIPPGILVIPANRSLPQRGRTYGNLNVAVCDSKNAGGKVRRAQVIQPQLGLSRSQTERNQQEERKMGGHGSSGYCKEAKSEICVKNTPVECLKVL